MPGAPSDSSVDTRPKAIASSGGGAGSGPSSGGPGASVQPAAIELAQSFLFDLDGTLVDSSPAHDRAFREALTGLSPEAARAFVYEPHKGKRTHQTFVDLGIEDETLVARLVARKQAVYRAAVDAGDVSLLPGARELLSAIERAGRLLVLVTGATRVSADRVLERCSIARFFAGIVTADDVKRGKPDPEPYTTALERHGLRARESVAIEDGEAGVRSARAAGLRVAGVHSPHLAGVDWLFASLGDLHTRIAPHLVPFRLRGAP